MEEKKLSFGLKLGYGIGTIGQDMIQMSMSLFLLNFLTDVVGLAAGLAGVAIMIGRVWDAFYDPIMGHISDKTMTRMGRRRPFILGGALPLALAMVMMFTNPSLIFGLGLSQTTLFAYVMITYLITCTAYSMVFIPYSSLVPELTTDYHERTSLNGYRNIFTVVGTLLGAGLALPIVDLCQDKSIGFLLMGSIFGVVMLISTLVMVYVVREPTHLNAVSSMNFWESYRNVFKNKPYVIILTVYILNQLAFALVSTVAIYYFKYILNDENMVTPGMIILFVTALIFIPVSVVLSKKVGKKIPYGIAFMIMATAIMVIFFFGPTQGVNFCLSMMCLIGVGLGLSYALPYTMVADAIEYDYLLTGERREGAFFGVWSLAAKVTQAMAVFLMGLALQLGGYVPNVMPQTQSAQLGIEIFLGPVNAAMFIIAAIVLYFYPITEERYKEILVQIADRDKRKSSL